MASQFTAAGRYTAEEFGIRFSAELARVRRRIGADDPGRMLTLLSVDQAGRTVVRPPWAVYPIEAEVAASLIADGMFFAVCMNPNKIIESLTKASALSGDTEVCRERRTPTCGSPRPPATPWSESPGDGGSPWTKRCGVCSTNTLRHRTPLTTNGSDLPTSRP
ncbi:hypothetical protein [Micromonospora sp. CP22]|uniref:hypothetical protein n=1 Tax=Micromonospora sp. CP22 TaxID=2580517 RepID=UPI0012BD0953|nr:hypothetical protein [Micromonospora sp. CP22]MTK05174.1 hypothetical protein [Micromonospora sp. CP22]